MLENRIKFTALRSRGPRPAGTEAAGRCDRAPGADTDPAARARRAPAFIGCEVRPPIPSPPRSHRHETLPCPSRRRGSSPPRCASAPRCSAAGRACSRDDYAKWMLEDLRVNFAIRRPRPGGRARSSRLPGRRCRRACCGVRAACAGRALVIEQAGTTCCCAKSGQAVGARSAGHRPGDLPDARRGTHYGADLPATATACCAPLAALAKPVAIAVVAGAPEGGCCTPKAGSGSGSTSGCC